MMNLNTDFSLLGHNTFQMDVKAACFVEYSSYKDLWDVLEKFRSGELPLPWMHIGSGSNLLFCSDYPGTILHSCIKGIEVIAETDENIFVKFGAGEIWDNVVDTCIERGWFGLENLSYIPGEIGAAAVQNIGAYGSEIREFINYVEVLDVETGNVSMIPAKKCDYGYRDSKFKNEWKKKYIVLSVVLKLYTRPHYKLTYGDMREMLGSLPVTAGRIRSLVKKLRDSKLPDPSVEGNAGSYFKNPVVSVTKLKELEWAYPEIPSYPVNATSVKIPAAWLIETAGWKGKVVGNVGVHPEQPLVLVNKGGATGEEVLALANEICKSVMDLFKIELHSEVNVI